MVRIDAMVVLLLASHFYAFGINVNYSSASCLIRSSLKRKLHISGS